MKAIYIFFLLICVSHLYGQVHPDFTVVDSDGVEHKLYDDYLNQGKTVVIKIFFVACPPCNAIAKDVQSLYETWGEGQYDVQFFEMTTLSSDDDNDVNGYKSQHGLTFPGISSEGNASSVVSLYRSGTFGTYYGTPSFAVIAPDGTTTYGTSNLENLNERIANTGATGKAQEAENTDFVVNFEWAKEFVPTLDSLTITLFDDSENGQEIQVPINSDGTAMFSYPSDAYPSMTSPKLRVAYQDDQSSAHGLNATDLILLTKHILNSKPFTEPEQILAADINGDNKLNATDLITLVKIILRQRPGFRNGVLPFVPLENDLDIVINPGNQVNLNFKMIKTGNFN